MDGLWFVAGFIAFVLVGSATCWILERYEARKFNPDTYMPWAIDYEAQIDVPLPVSSRPKVYDWDERGDFS